MAVRYAHARIRACCRLSLPALLALCLCWSPALAAATGRPALDGAIGVHSMLYLSHPFAAKEAMFREAAASGASSIRLDIELSGVFQDPSGRPDWSAVDEYMLLARRYRLHVLAVLHATPWYLTDCPPGAAPDSTYRCPPSNVALWARQTGLVAAHTHGVIEDFEILNEPDGRWAFFGTLQQYARMLTAAYIAIHSGNPEARVALGGLMDTSPAGWRWTQAVFATPNANARNSFDIANVHVRSRARHAGSVVARWRKRFASVGFRGPLWVTETGYPADPDQQFDPDYRGGAPAQAAYLRRAILAMIRAGAAKVFVTERDSLAGPFASEGVLDTTDPLTATYKRRPSFYAVRALARRLTSMRHGSRGPHSTPTPAGSRPTAPWPAGQQRSYATLLAL